MSGGMDENKVGLALGGGGARALAHIGVLKVLEDVGIGVSCVAGTSMGGIIAAGYAAGLSAADLEAESLRMSSLRQIMQLVDLAPPRRGLVSGRRMRAYLEGILGPDVAFKDLNLPLSLNAVDLRTDREVILREGSVVDAAMATSAYPGVFPPVRIDGRVLVDGGVLNNVPVSLARKMDVDFILAVDVSKSIETLIVEDFDDRRSTILGFAQTFFHAAELMQRSRLQANLDKTPPDLLLRPSVAPHIGIFTGFTHAEEIIAAGEAEARRTVPRLLALMGRAAPSRSTMDMQASPSRDQIPTLLKMA